MMTYVRYACLIVLLGLGLPSHGYAIDTQASHAIIMDHNTGAILLEKQAYDTMYPASMTKMMTAYMMFDALKSGELSLEDTYPVSELAWRKGGSKMFVRLGEDVSIKDLMQGIVIQSGNDACIVFAEGFAGGEVRFAERMTKKARELGMKHTVFKNATGWPDEEHVTSAYDLAVLARETVKNFPEYYTIYAQRDYTYNDIQQYNRNVLLMKNIGIDGMKTGHTEAAGYGITVSGEQDGRRVHVVVGGLDSEKARARAAEKLYRYAFAEFENIRPHDDGIVVGEVPLWYGAMDAVAVTTAPGTVLTVPTIDTEKLSAEIIYRTGLSAPIAKGDVVGVLEVTIPNASRQQVEVVAAQDVEEAGYMKRLITNIGLLVSDKP